MRTLWYKTPKCEGQKEEDKIWKELINDSRSGKETKGNTIQHDKKGSYETAEEDFNKLHPTNVQSLGNSKFRGKWGDMLDGSNIIVRDGSKGKRGQLGPPTLVRQNDKKNIKIRYN